MSTAAAEAIARVADFSQLSPAATSPDAPLDIYADIPITLTARLGQAALTIGDLLKLGPGATVPLDRDVLQPIDLVVGGKVFARGEVVVVNDRFAVRLKELAGRPAGGDR